MEVKSIFINHIMKTYEKKNMTNPSNTTTTKDTLIKDKVFISPRANIRLFEDLMEYSLKKSLSED